MNPSTRTLAALSLPLALVACGGVGSSGSGGAAATTDIPAAIAAPSGHTLAMTLKGSGVQTYECRAKPAAAGGYDWALVGPEAALRDRSDAIVGRHYAGPTWEYGDDSKVTGKVVADVPAPTPGDIPWLLLQGTPVAHPGAFAAVTYIQRIHTSGGIAPSDTCAAATVGTKKAVRYAADYLFYRR